MSEPLVVPLRLPSLVPCWAMIAFENDFMPIPLPDQRARHPPSRRHARQRPPHRPHNARPEPGPKAPSRQQRTQRARRAVGALRDAVHGAQDGRVRAGVVDEDDGGGEGKCAGEDLDEEHPDEGCVEQSTADLRGRSDGRGDDG